MKARAIDDAKDLIKQLAEEIAAAEAEIAETETEKLKASETRQEENSEFQATVKDQRDAQAILNKALNRLKQFYKKKGFLQAPGDALGDAPDDFKAYKKNSAAAGVLQLISNVIEDSEKTEKECISAEETSQTEYETFIGNANDSIKALKNEVTCKREQTADTKAELSTLKGDHTDLGNQLTALGNESKDLHTQCDFLLKNFDIRQQAHASEMEALANAKAILSGADFS